MARLSVTLGGGYWHPLDQFAIDGRWSEEIASTEFPRKRMQIVKERCELDCDGLDHPRAVVIWNMEGTDLQSFPTPEQEAELRQRVLYVGFPGAERAIELRPYIPNAACQTQQGQSVCLPLSPGAQVILSPAAGTVQVKTLILPR